MEELLQSLAHPRELSPLMIFGLILLGGALGGKLARLCKFPSITGNILAGVLIGPYVLGIVSGEDTIQALQPFSTFAAGLIAVAIGGHLSYARIHNALGRIFSIAFLEVLVTLGLVSSCALLLGASWPLALLLGSLSIDTAPGTLIHIVKENRAKGPFVKTLLSVVAIDNMLAIAVFAVVKILVGDFYQKGLGGMNIWVQLLHPAWQLLGSIVMGLLLGKIVGLLVRRPQYHNFSTAFVAILIGVSASDYIGMSPLLTCLFLGVFMANSSVHVEEQLSALDPIEPLLYICFFTLAGVTLHLDMLGGIGVLGGAFLLARVGGKALGSMLGGLLSSSAPRIWKNIPLGLMPQAGVAIALVILLQSDTRIPQEIRTLASTIVLAAVVINEIVGPLLTRLALVRAKEVNKERPRLVEFLQEEFITTGLKATDKYDAIRQLCDFLIRTHKVEHVHPDDLFNTVVEREKTQSTAIGKGAAIPHGLIDSGPAIQGVMGIFPKGIDFEADDGLPVRIIVLIVTPREHMSKHLSVLASLAAMISHEVIRSRLFTATNSYQAWEIIESEETPDYNYFLGD